MSDETDDELDWKLVQDFDDAEPAHSQARWEYAVIHSGQMVALRETDPITRNTHLQYIPAGVFAGVAAEINMEEGDSA